MVRESNSLPPKNAGQRPDELLPGENSGAVLTGDEATGSPAGGLGASGVAGLPSGDGSPGNAELHGDTGTTHPSINASTGSDASARQDSGSIRRKF